MKTLLVTSVLLSSIFAEINAQTPAANTEDLSAIKKTIADETDGYFKRNYQQWSGAWAHEPYLQWSANGSDGVVLLANGWNDYNDQLRANFAETKPAQIANVQRENYQVSILGNAATATFNQTLQLGTYHGISREVRVLEKKGSSWKLVYVNSRTTP